MPAPILLLVPYLLVAGAAVLPPGRAARGAAACVAAVALGAAAAARVPNGTGTFVLINGALLYGGLVLFGMLAVLALEGRGRPEARDAAAPGGSDRHALALPGTSGALGRWGLPVALGALLLPAAWFTVTVAGPDARSLLALRDAPFSPAGEILFAALLLPATLLLAGTWPFGRLARGPRLAPVAAFLLALVILPMAGDGVAHWRSVYAAWLVIGAMVAAMAPYWPALMAGGGLFAIACGGQGGSLAGAGLTAIASLLCFRPAMDRRLRRAAYVTAGACAIAGLRGTLASEVVYSVLMLVVVVIAILRTPLAAETS